MRCLALRVAVVLLCGAALGVEDPLALVGAYTVHLKMVERIHSTHVSIV